jgi:hypothetical protein
VTGIEGLDNRGYRVQIIEIFATKCWFRLGDYYINHCLHCLHRKALASHSTKTNWMELILLSWGYYLRKKIICPCHYAMPKSICQGHTTELVEQEPRQIRCTVDVQCWNPITEYCNNANFLIFISTCSTLHNFAQAGWWKCIYEAQQRSN